MPSRFTDTSPRRWGTRFDTLSPSSPPSGPSSTAGGSNQTEPSFSPRPGPANPCLLGENNDKMPHDASIFVGSLPSSVEQQDLMRALTEHLSKYAVIKNVKVVRDTRGSVCAFVQCEDAAAANQLIDTLHSQPSQPFLGRFLRYEKARSSRSLLLSYRAPTQYIPPLAINSSSAGSNYGEGAQGITVPIEPATAMRIFRNRGARYFSIIYNDQARNYQCDENEQEKGMFLSPLKFDAESITKIVSSFGPIDEICSYKPNDAAIKPPHDAPRAPGMELDVWEIKFNHRNDALSALMTLRTVPHLTITWTHQTYDRGHRPYNCGQGSSLTQSCFDGDDREASWTPQARGTNAVEKTSPVLSPVFPSIQSIPREDQGDDESGLGSLPSFTDDDFPPLAGKQTSWADDVVTIHEDFMFTSTPDISSESVDNLPPTPDFTASSITPLTPKTASGFPRTPRSGNLEIMPNSCDGPYFDRLSLFVGGLPPYWEEDTVGEIFQRFGGLESVRVIRPLTKKGTAFAFVKFDNPNSPQQAILEENDRVREGRHIRVQLRDMNPPGRYGRKRRFPYGAPEIQGDMSTNGLNLDMMGISDNRDTDHAFVNTGDTLPPQSYIPSSTSERILEFPRSPIEAEAENSISSSSVSTSPHPSSENSAPVQQPALLPYPVPFYAPAPWMAGYPPPYAYPVQYVPGYPAFAAAPSYMPHATTSSASGTYAMMPLPTDPVLGQQRPAQPPLQPTGFIQGEQGTLIPVYPTEALERYMSDNRHVGATTSPPLPTDVPTPIPTAVGPQFHQPPQVPAYPYPQNSMGQWSMAPRQPQSQFPVVPGHYMPSQPKNGMVSPAHRAFPQGPGFQGHDYRGKRQHRPQNNSNNRNPNSHSLPHRNHYASSNGFENTHQVPIAATAQDWTMWTGNR